MNRADQQPLLLERYDDERVVSALPGLFTEKIPLLLRDVSARQRPASGKVGSPAGELEAILRAE